MVQIKSLVVKLHFFINFQISGKKLIIDKLKKLVLFTFTTFDDIAYGNFIYNRNKN